VGADPLDLGLDVPGIDQRLAARNQAPVRRHDAQVGLGVVERALVAIVVELELVAQILLGEGSLALIQNRGSISEGCTGQ